MQESKIQTDEQRYQILPFYPTQSQSTISDYFRLLSIHHSDTDSHLNSDSPASSTIGLESQIFGSIRQEISQPNSSRLEKLEKQPFSIPENYGAICSAKKKKKKLRRKRAPNRYKNVWTINVARLKNEELWKILIRGGKYGKYRHKIVLFNYLACHINKARFSLCPTSKSSQQYLLQTVLDNSRLENKLIALANQNKILKNKNTDCQRQKQKNSIQGKGHMERIAYEQNQRRKAEQRCDKLYQENCKLKRILELLWYAQAERVWGQENEEISQQQAMDRSMEDAMIRSPITSTN